MAVTILTAPSGFPSLHDDNYFVVSSTNVTVEDFKYIFDVTVNGQLVARCKINPAPSAENSYGVFNSAPIVRNYIDNYFKPSGDSVLQCTSNGLKVAYQVRVGEEVSGVITMGSTNNYVGYNYCPPLFFDSILTLGNGGDLVLSDQYENLLISNYANDFLTDRDINAIDLIFGDRLFLSFFSTAYNSAAVEVQKINEDGSNNGAAMTGASVSINEFSMWDFSAARINEYLSTEFITEDNFGYKVRLVFSSIESNWVRIKHVCYAVTNPVNIHFLNRLGGWDTFSFNLINKQRVEVERKSFQRTPYQLAGSAMTNNDQYNRYNEGKINYSTQHKDTFKLTSDYLSEDNYTWLAQLFYSSIAYMEVRGAFFPITITDSDYTYKIDKSDGLFNLELNVEVGKYNNSQYR